MSKSTHTPATQPARHHINVLGQILKLIPRGIIDKAAKETGVDAKARTYTVLSHLGTMLFVQLAHALSLNDVCDWLRLKARAIASFGLTPPSRNNLSNSNKVRDATFAALVFWRTLAHLQHCDRSFGKQRPGGGRSLLYRFKVPVHAVDSTVMELVANCMDWALATAPMPSAGRYGPRCWCMCCCATQRTSASGSIASHGSLPWCARRCGSDSIFEGCCEVMGQQVVTLPCWEPRTPHGSRALRRRARQRMGQHRPDLPGKHAKISTRPPSLSNLPPLLLQGLPLIRHGLWDGCGHKPLSTRNTNRAINGLPNL